MTFKIITLGCKVNTYESEYMLEQLKASGFIYRDVNPDIIIINTCSVTNMADLKSLKMVRREKRLNPEAILVVCGCSVQNDISKYQKIDIDILIGNQSKSEIVTLINNFLENKENYQYINQDRHLEFENMKVDKFTTHTRAFIKIQDGCNNFCSYCIIPYTRGNTRSKNFALTINEAKCLVKNSHKEIVLTGIHTGSYNDSGKDLSDLLVALAQISGLSRLRISSIEVTELDTKFLNVLKKTSQICNHLHIPLQSGSDEVLKRMNRKYDTAYFKDKIKKIREIRPDIAITTDVIVGHPYETDENFQETLDFCKMMGFSKIHVFPYSLRQGTASSLMPQVNPRLKKQRANKLTLLSQELEEAYMQKFIGQKVFVLTEVYENNFTVGHTSNYLKVYIEGKVNLNEEYECLITKYNEHMLISAINICAKEKTNV